MPKIFTKNEYIEHDTYTILRITSVKHGIFDMLLDDEDVDKCKEKHWNINKYNHLMKRDYFYAVAMGGILLHRYIMDTPKGLVTDHRDGNKLDNRKQNLQICTVKENSRKSQFRLTNKSGHSGVIWYPHHNYNKWKATIIVDYKTINLGYFDDINDAIKVREQAELKYFGEFQPVSNCTENAGNVINT